MTGPRCTTPAPSRRPRTRSVRGARALHPRPRLRAPPHDRRRHRLSLHGYSHRCIPIEAQKADYPLAFMCRLWGVPRGVPCSSFCARGAAGRDGAPSPRRAFAAAIRVHSRPQGRPRAGGSSPDARPHRRLSARSDYHEIFLKDCKSLPGITRWPSPRPCPARHYLAAHHSNTMTPHIDYQR
jgi:hypothetical protein